ncbi:MAG: hypothetical protein GX024_03905 [Clostridiales bacterium]|nr:hypothetical protein [Clostridiales bacterium]
MKEEARKILKMVEEKKITAEEAEKLMDMLEPDNAGIPSFYAGADGNFERFLKVKVVEDGNNKIDVNVPLSLVEIGLKLGTLIGAEFEPKLQALKSIDFNELVNSINNGAQGKLVEIEDDDTYVSVTVE